MKINLRLASFLKLKKTNFGFSLIELVIVVVIIGVLSSIGYVNYIGVIEKARSAEAYQVLSEIVGAEQAYYVENSSYTSTFSDLDTFESAPTSDNFNYTIPSTSSTSGYAQAARSSSGNGRLSYGMCLATGEKKSCDASTCDPGC